MLLPVSRSPGSAVLGDLCGRDGAGYPLVMDDKLTTAAAGSVALFLATMFPGFSLSAGVIPPAAEVFKALLGSAGDARRKAALDDLIDEVVRLDGYDGQERENRLVELLASGAPPLHPRISAEQHLPVR